MNFILKLKPASYNYIKDVNKTRRDGLIAQDVQEALTDLGLEFSALVIDDDPIRTLNLSYELFVVPLITAVKEQQVVIDTQRNQIFLLQAQINNLERLVNERISE